MDHNDRNSNYRNQNMIEYMDEKSNYKEHKDNHVRYRIIQKVKSDLEKISKEL